MRAPRAKVVNGKLGTRATFPHGTKPFLVADEPLPRVDRIVGLLDSLTMSTRTGLLKLDDGILLKGHIAASVDLDGLKSLLGFEVVVEGTVAFRPSGRPQRIEIDHVARAGARDLVWKRTPRGKLGHKQLVPPSEGLDHYFGQWPGDEDDEQVFAALRELA